MASTDRSDSEAMRLRVLLAAVLGAFCFLGAMLWRVQITHASQYESSLFRQSMRRVRLPGPRGRIFDRNGVCLADNRPSYCVAMYVEELREAGRWERTIDRIDREIDKLAGVLRLARTTTRKDIASHIYRRRPLPFVVWRDIDEAAMARLEESDVAIPGVDIHVSPVRVYPLGEHAAHVLGHVGHLEPDPSSSFDFYLPEIEGKGGVERVLDATLTGQAGGRLIRVDASGFKHTEELEGGKNPTPGLDVVLTLDMRIQKAAEHVLAGRPGAVVVLDPRNGDILALASAPAFDPNIFVPSLSREEWHALSSDAALPLFNRAVSGAYAPGSTFKPLVAIAALENDRASRDTLFDCPGYFALGEARFHCWKRSGHGMLAMRKALEQSCNSYFCQLGLRCGYERIYHMAEALGFGQQTGVKLPGEVSGLLPNSEWKQDRYNDVWRSGDTCNVSIGQGPLLVTPLQLARFVAAIASGGRLCRPRIVLRTKPGEETAPTIEDMGWRKSTQTTVGGGMYDVIHAPEGTGKRAWIEGVEMAGKTGTAQYGRAPNMKTHAWMMLFAPARDPRYAVAMIIENGVSGGITVAPCMRELMTEIFRLEGEAVPPAGQSSDGPPSEGLG